MKKISYLFFTLIIALLSSCSGDEIVTEIPQKEPDPGTLSADTQDLYFLQLGGSATIKVTAQDIDIWQVTPSITWIEIEAPNFTTGEFTVTIPETDLLEDREGKILIHAADGSSPVTINVVQKGWGEFNSRPTTKRMNLNGNVEFLGFHGNLMLMADANYYYYHIDNIEFNREGYITSYTFDRLFAPVVYTYYIDIEYDDQNRITKMSGTAPGLSYTDGPYETVLEFKYGNHGKYIAVDRIMAHLEGIYVEHCYDLWMPVMMKDLESVHLLTPTVIGGAKFDYDITVIGNEGMMRRTYTNLSYDVVQELDFNIEFANNYTSSLTFTQAITYDPVDQMQTYKVDARNGNLLHTKLEYYYVNNKGEGNWVRLMERSFHNNFYNSLYDEYTSAFVGMYTASAEYLYDENWNLSGFDAGTSGTGQFSYEYDRNGNWTTVTGHLEADREILYYE